MEVNSNRYYEDSLSNSDSSECIVSLDRNESDNPVTPLIQSPTLNSRHDGRQSDSGDDNRYYVSGREYEERKLHIVRVRLTCTVIAAVLIFLLHLIYLPSLRTTEGEGRRSVRLDSLADFPEHEISAPAVVSYQPFGSSVSLEDALSQILSSKNKAGRDDEGKYASISIADYLIADPSLVIVTAVSSSYFDRLANLVGSVHYWAPGQSVIVFDLGLTIQQQHAIKCWENVDLVLFPFHLFPQHVKNVFNYHFKVLLMYLTLNGYATNEWDSMSFLSNDKEELRQKLLKRSSKDRSIIFLDSGIEIRHPLTIPYIRAHVLPKAKSDGYWLAQQPNTVDAKTHPQTLERLGISLDIVKGKPFCAGGIQAWQLKSKAYEEVLVEVALCALDESCYAPIGSGQNNHRTEQSVFSSLIYATGRRCEPSRVWREWDMSTVTEDESLFNSIQLSARRWHNDHQYVRHIQLKDSSEPIHNKIDPSFTPRGHMDKSGNVVAFSFPTDPPINSDSMPFVCTNLSSLLHNDEEGVFLPFPPNSISPDEWFDGKWNEKPTAAHIEALLLSHVDATKLDGDSPLRHCLSQNNGSRVACLPFVRDHMNVMYAHRFDSQMRWPRLSSFRQKLQFFTHIFSSSNHSLIFGWMDVVLFRLLHRLRWAWFYLIISTIVVMSIGDYCFRQYRLLSNMRRVRNYTDDDVSTQSVAHELDENTMFEDFQIAFPEISYWLSRRRARTPYRTRKLSRLLSTADDKHRHFDFQYHRLKYELYIVQRILQFGRLSSLVRSLVMIMICLFSAKIIGILFSLISHANSQGLTRWHLHKLNT